MGWSEGGVIGLTNPKFVKPIEFVSRPGYRSGLGADQNNLMPPASRKKRKLKPGEKHEDFEQKMLPTDENGVVRHTKSLDEKLVPISKLGMQVGSLVGIISGRHDGLYARVLRIGSDDQVAVRLEASDEEVIVAKGDLTLINESKLQQEHPALKFAQQYEKTNDNDKEKNNDKSKEHIKNSNSKHTNSKDKDQDLSKSESSSKSAFGSSKSWLFPHTIVRIISKSFANGKYYLKKGKIVDVIGGGQCTLQLLETKKLVEVQQKMLETVIPRVGDKVMIVEGTHSGQVGKLMAKSTDESCGQAVIQLAGDLSINNFNLDSITHYTDPSNH